MVEPPHCACGFCPHPYLLFRHLLVGKELVNFPVVLEAPGKEEDHVVPRPPPSLQPHTARNSVRHKAACSSVRMAHGITHMTLGAQ